jgi:cell division protease FtsH
MHEMEDAIDRIVTGGPERKSRVISDKEKETVAFHEAAHALIGKLLPHTDPVHKISIIPRGGALGYVMQLPVEDRYLITKSEILDRVTMALAGRAAEELIFGEVSSGAQDDLEKATKMVRKMITEFGMSDKLGPLTYGEKNDNPFLGRDIARGRNYSEEVASAIDHEISHTINTCYEKATKMLKKHRDNLDLIANELKEKETLEGSELEELIEAPEKVS